MSLWIQDPVWWAGWLTGTAGAALGVWWASRKKGD